MIRKVFVKAKPMKGNEMRNQITIFTTILLACFAISPMARAVSAHSP
jgi:hypothetical protein